MKQKIDQSRSESQSDDDSDEFDPLNAEFKAEEGWEDIEPDVEEGLIFQSLFDSTTFTSLESFIAYDREKYSFDLRKVKVENKLDFLDTVKLVNFVRLEVSRGIATPITLDLSGLSDDKYLQPVLDDDAVLFSLGDLEEQEDASVGNREMPEDISPAARIAELERELVHAQELIKDLRLLSQRAFDDVDEPDREEAQESREQKALAEMKENDSLYFKSYAYNDIHEIMLKDTVRTDAYRDFIYDNKDLFVGKTVLDVGCGTGILSMMCAKAGAKKVFAVDNSDIINKARANVFENSLQHIVTCLHGKIEDVTLPVPKVDIIVSEWMGYALLYESMLDSVISARDRYLAPNGLMVPSHSTIFLAPISVPDIVSDRVGFWQDVYGFRMPAMLEGIHNEVLLRNLTATDVVGSPSAVLQLPLHTCTVADTVFKDQNFDSKLERGIDCLDGFALWFDMYFARSRDEKMKPGVQAAEWQEGVAFTTGPGKSTTHWMQAVLLIDRLKETAEGKTLSNGTSITGEIGYERRKENDRQLDIDLRWVINGVESRKQKWELA